MKKIDAPTNESAPTKQVNFNASAAQRQRLLTAMQSMPEGITTIAAREVLDVIAPAPRIFELRHVYDLNIQTIWDTDSDVLGHSHRVARYVLFPGKWSEAV